MTESAPFAIALVVTILGGGSLALLRGGLAVRWLRLALVGLAALGLAWWLHGNRPAASGNLDVATALAVSTVVLAFLATSLELGTRRPWALGAAAASVVVVPTLLFAPAAVAVTVAVGGWVLSSLQLAIVMTRVALTRPGSLLDARLRTMVAALAALSLSPLVALGDAGEVVATVAFIGGSVVLWVAVAPPPGVALVLTPTSAVARAASRELTRLADPDHDPTEAMRRIRALFGAEAVVLTDDGRPLSDAGAALDVSAADAAVEELERHDLAHGTARLHVVETGDRWVLVGDTGRGWLAVVLDHLGPLLSRDDRDRVAAVAEEVGLALDRGDAQRRDRHAAASLRAIDRMRDDLLATLSHELRTPLTSIRGFSEVLREHGDRLGKVQQLDLLDRVVAKSGDLERMIGGLLELTAVRGRSGPDRIGRYELRDLVDRALGRAARRLADRVVELDVPAIGVTTDGGAVLAVLDHLLDNFAKFTPPESRARIAVRELAGTVELMFTDDGPGLADLTADEAMQPFVRGGDVLTRETRGVGIGLTIARELAHQLGGDLCAVEGSHGAAFRFTFAVRHILGGPTRTGPRRTATDAEQHHPDVYAPAPTSTTASSPG